MKNTVLTLLPTDLVTDPTRQVLTERLNAPVQPPTFFSPDELTLLRAVCDRLVPQEAAGPIDVAGGIDQRLAKGDSDGWRYDEMPPDGDACRQGLRGIDESGRAMFGQTFGQISEAQQDEVLKAVQAANAPGDTWQTLPANRFFEDLLAEAAGMYYCHPLAQQEINYVGMADASGWQRIGLNQLEEREK